MPLFNKALKFLSVPGWVTAMEGYFLQKHQEIQPSRYYGGEKIILLIGCFCRVDDAPANLTQVSAQFDFAGRPGVPFVDGSSTRRIEGPFLRKDGDGIMV